MEAYKVVPEINDFKDFLAKTKSCRDVNTAASTKLHYTREVKKNKYALSCHMDIAVSCSNECIL